MYIFADKKGLLLHKPLLVDMSENVGCFIEGIYDDYEILNLIKSIHFDPASLLDDSME